MAKHILFALLSGFLMFGMSNAFAEEPQLTDQEILKAWGQAQTDVKEVAEMATMEKKGLNAMTDKDLDKINAAGLITTKFGRFGLIVNANATVKGGGFVSCSAIIGACFNDW